MTLDVLAHHHDLTDRLVALGHPAFRADQIRDWIFNKGVLDPGQMGNLPAALRQAVTVGSLDSRRVDRSNDGTIKLLLEAPGEGLVEAVGIPMDGRDAEYTICVSSQTGCAMGCVFCATGTLTSPRNLSGARIVEQVLRQWEAAGVRPSRVVFMGMGEPLANPVGVNEALDILTGPMGLSSRRLTVSTVGLVDGIRRLADRRPPVNLAVSLHSAIAETRRQLVPNVKSSLDDIESAARDYRRSTGRDVTYEIVLLAGVNDDRRHAEALAARAGDGVTVNLIPYNPGGAGDWGRPNDEAVEAFRKVLERARVPVTVRRQRGSDINAACGELAAR